MKNTHWHNVSNSCWFLFEMFTQVILDSKQWDLMMITWPRWQTLDWMWAGVGNIKTPPGASSWSGHQECHHQCHQPQHHIHHHQVQTSQSYRAMTDGQHSTYLIWCGLYFVIHCEFVARLMRIDGNVFTNLIDFAGKWEFIYCANTAQIS